PTFLLDALTATASIAFSTRKLRSAYSGFALQVNRSSDNTNQDIGFVSNNLDEASMVTFVGGGDGRLNIFYDQSGNAVNAAVGNGYSRLIVSGVKQTINSRCVPFWDRAFATNITYPMAAPNLVQPVTVALCARETSGVTSAFFFDGSTLG